jgi:hypothetical protein
MSEAKVLVNNRRTDFTSEAERVTYDAKKLIEIAKLKYGKFTVQDVLDLATRQSPQEESDHIDTPEYKELLKQEIAVQIKGKEPILNVTKSVSAQATETAKEINEKGVSLEAITTFVAGLKLKFGVAKEKVLERLQTALTPEKLKSLMYFQDNGHQLDVTAVTAAGVLEFDTCSIESPDGEHRNKNYFQSLELATSNGATLMTKAKYEQIGRKFDPNTWSWLFSPHAGTPDKPGRAFRGDYGGVDGYDRPKGHDYAGAFRVSLRV